MVLSIEQWVGKVAIVTGASAGLGAEIVSALVKQGIKVAGLARRSYRIESLAKELSGERGKLIAIKYDVTREQEILEAFKYVEENLGPVSILINNAGSVKNTELINGNTEMWKQTFDTNVLGLCIATREAIRSMKAHDINGHIIHINSVCGHKVFACDRVNVYFATKHAVTALAETLRHEINRDKLKIKITSQRSPGMAKSEIREQAYGKSIPKELQDMPELSEEDVADAVIYALSTPPHVNVSEIIIQPIGEKI